MEARSKLPQLLPHNDQPAKEVSYDNWSELKEGSENESQMMYSTTEPSQHITIITLKWKCCAWKNWKTRPQIDPYRGDKPKPSIATASQVQGVELPNANIIPAMESIVDQ